MKVKYTVYSIIVNGVVRYIGRTNNLHRRELEHRRAYRNGKEKPFYNWLREVSLDPLEIRLTAIEECGSKTESKRIEMYLILHDYFNKKELKQSVPSISDR